MPAFDVTANPTTVTAKPGEKQTIVVTVTNRLGRAVTGRAIATVNPPSGAAWIKLPPDPQRVFSQPNATLEYRFGLELPATATPGAYQVRIDVVDIELPDDNFGQSQTIALTVLAVAAPVPVVKPRFPWWIWLVAAVVVIGAGVTIWKVTSGSGGDPEEACAPTFTQETAPRNNGDIALGVLASFNGTSTQEARRLDNGDIVFMSRGPNALGALVYLDGRCQGTMQARGSSAFMVLSHVPAGSYTVRISKRGFKDEERTVTVVAGQKAPVLFNLQP